MNVAWLIIDSLSFSATPFAEDGPDTMPQLAALAEEEAISFTNAYAPGPTSPSSHGSFFTGELPSSTGMHEAHPYFDGRYPTIAEALADTHQSYMISANPFIFNGLYRGFDEIEDLKFTNESPFPEATDPITFNHVDSDSGLAKVRSYLLDDGKPIRSLANGIDYKLRGRQRDPTECRFAETICERVSEFVSSTDEDAFAVTNFMEVHAPLDASDEAIDRFAAEWDRESLPIDVKGEHIHQRIKDEPDYEGEDMYALYLAAIWDIDRKVAPLVRELLDQDTLVVVTADHGNWFRRDHDLDEERIHVPLLVFGHESAPRTVDKTVNLRSLPRTTLDALDHPNAGTFSGTSLLQVDDHQCSITEFIHNDAETGVPVTPSGKLGVDEEIVYQIAAIQGDGRVDFDGENVTVARPDPEYEEDLRETIATLRQSNVAGADGSIDYDGSTRQRLESLGYLD
ncbi:sulfatase-like hydrolase/transferase [Halovenus sp. WSH3]|uniref:Sulfatase-like hydrolase/transferase n=1 Tax=Halovenus carboxidivorans TaxID=2692199 RepID=A0A6B0SZA5_9EURY|nr:sulfatase-like hydrolase/transferase [Halovenus carboxidivorans]MXR51178.1 sulfatase-like hydrolase/transferase [Halovenus carboxidivorans]